VNNKLSPALHPTAQDLTGKRFGRLTVVKFAGYRTIPSGKKQAAWRCVCDCGNVKDIRVMHLRSGTIKSCGCLRVEVNSNSERGLTGFNKLLDSYKQNCKKTGRSWRLSKKQVRKITSSACFYCGDPPSTAWACNGTKSKLVKDHGVYMANGIDRVDSRKGYTVDNVVPCCAECNQMKSDRKLTRFVKKAEQIFMFFSLGIPKPEEK
jgi:hypothetical protein